MQFYFIESNAISFVLNAAAEAAASLFSQEVSVNERIIIKYKATTNALIMLNVLILIVLMLIVLMLGFKWLIFVLKYVLKKFIGIHHLLRIVDIKYLFGWVVSKNCNNFFKWIIFRQVIFFEMLIKKLSSHLRQFPVLIIKKNGY